MERIPATRENMVESNAWNAEMSKYMEQLQDEFLKERKRHVEQNKVLIKELRYLKAKCYRESSFRADLCYQKKYLLLLIGGLESCEQASMLLISNMGNRPRLPPSLAKLRSSVTAVIAIQRMR